MSSVINTNISSLNAQRNLSMSQSSLRTSIERLSSGLRVNSSKDDAAGLGIATRMDAQVRGMTVAQRNANDGVSMLQVADGALTTITDALQRMRELAVQSANGTNGTADQTNLDAEYQKLSAEITRIAAAAKFNNVAVFSATAVAIQVGANNGDTVSFTVGAVATVAGAIATTAGANTALTALDTKLDAITAQRATLGAAQNQLGYAISNLQVGVENQSAAMSRIMDADFAAETANMTRGQILQQAGTAMVAQANSMPNSVLKLLQ